MSIVPVGLGMRDYLVIYKTLERVKAEVLAGRPSGVVIDQALAEAFKKGTDPSSSPVSEL